jgi:hypothetical protein
MSDNKQSQIQENTQVFNLLLIIICSALTIFGVYQVFSNRLEDGLINMIIGLGLSSIPFGGSFNYKEAPKWQKVIFFLLSIFVVASSLYLIYTIFAR